MYLNQISFSLETLPADCNFPPYLDTCSKIEAYAVSSPMSDGTVPASFCYTPWSTVYGICPGDTPGVVQDNCKEMCKDVSIPGKVCNSIINRSRIIFVNKM